jgi:hypothetical protein
MFKLYHVSMVGKPAKRRHQVENARLLALVGLLLACMAARPVLAWNIGVAMPAERAFRASRRSRLRM